MSTTTATVPTASGESFRIDPVADMPADCPPWCRGHSAQYADDFGTFKSREEMSAALSDWRTHRRYIGDVTLWALTHSIRESQNWVERPQTEDYHLSLESSGDAGGSLTPVLLSLYFRNDLHMTSAEARQLAAYLIRAADVADRDENDQ